MSHSVRNQVGAGSTAGITYSALQQSLSVSVDFRRIGRCMNLEAMLEAWIMKHGYELYMHSGWFKVYAKGEHAAPIASFPVYELALQFVLDAIDKDIEKDADDAWKYRENSK